MLHIWIFDNNGQKFKILRIICHYWFFLTFFDKKFESSSRKTITQIANIKKPKIIILRTFMYFKSSRQTSDVCLKLDKGFLWNGLLCFWLHESLISQLIRDIQDLWLSFSWSKNFRPSTPLVWLLFWKDSSRNLKLVLANNGNFVSRWFQSISGTFSDWGLLQLPHYEVSD